MTSRAGVAIPFTLLFTLALYALAWGVFVTASSSVRSARAGVTLAELSSVGQTRIAAEIAQGPGALADSVAVGATGVRPDSAAARPVTTTWTRLSAEEWLVQVHVAPGPADFPGPPTSASRLVWHVDAQTRVDALADVTVGPGAVVSIGGAPTARPSIAVADSILIGLLSLDALMDDALPLTGTVSPRSVTRSGRCETTLAENLGDPLGTSSCRPFVAHRRADGDVELRGGAGQVLLVGRADIALTGGVYLRGLLVTEGVVRVTDGTFEGLIIALGGVEVAAGAVFMPDPVFGGAALEAYAEAHPGARLLHEARDLFGS